MLPLKLLAMRSDRSEVIRASSGRSAVSPCRSAATVKSGAAHSRTCAMHRGADSCATGRGLCNMWKARETSAPDSGAGPGRGEADPAVEPDPRASAAGRVPGCEGYRGRVSQQYRGAGSRTAAPARGPGHGPTGTPIGARQPDPHAYVGKTLPDGATRARPRRAAGAGWRRSLSARPARRRSRRPAGTALGSCSVGARPLRGAACRHPFSGRDWQRQAAAQVFRRLLVADHCRSAGRRSPPTSGRVGFRRRTASQHALHALRRTLSGFATAARRAIWRKRASCCCCASAR